MRYLLLVVLPCVFADTQVVRLFHRIYHPLEHPPKYSQRGVLRLSPTPVLFNTAPHDLLHFPDDLDHLLYQVALEHDSDPDESYWDFSTVKACHLASHTEDKFMIHLTDQGKAFAIDYFVAPISHDGSCPTRVLDRPSAIPAFPNSTIVLRSHGIPPQPTLRSPPPLTPEGTIVEPIPEKSFFQKYWMYFLAVGMLILISGSAPDEEEVGRRRRD